MIGSGACTIPILGATPQSLPPSAGLTISFTQIEQAPSITGPVISRTGAGYSKTATLSVSNPGDYSSIQWEITGTSFNETGASIELNAADARYNQIGNHYLTLTVVKGGIPYSSTVTFEVRN